MDRHQLPDPETWVDEHGDALFRYALLRLKDPVLAEDMVQETLLAAFRGRETFKGHSTLRTWLFGILKHKIVDHIRKASRELSVDHTESKVFHGNEPFDERGGWRQGPAKWATDPGLLFRQREFWGVLQECLTELPLRQHQAFTLRELDGLSIAEICKILGVSTTNGGVLLHRARLRLRECLEGNWFSGEHVKRE
ncbi:MAG: sigma-70 family RNA polymerase sigma factor [Deltaproteobacteria bacterium]|nr:sigma-70 family RNA polymerase sigma factor [Deltaproteobacteria bacterium]MBW2072224.1 sigma-70 family RNA polymerase sigma factor [Deltaproteobacteria bacterium]